MSLFLKYYLIISKYYKLLLIAHLMLHIQFFKTLINLIIVLFIRNNFKFIFLIINVDILSPNIAHLPLLNPIS
jgi:hypothetical protein